MAFTNNLKVKLQEKGLSDSSIKMYIRNLQKLNNNNDLKNFKFLDDMDEIMDKLKNYKDNTKRSYLISIVSSLGAVKPNSKLYKKYFNKMIEIHNEIKKKPENTLSSTQEKNWMKWEEVKEIYEKLKDKVEDYGKRSKKVLNKKEWENLLNYVVASLYILMPPRRNQDYQRMLMVKKYNPDLPESYNYMDKEKMYFNTYKTSKKYGQQVIEIPDELKKVLKLWYKFRGSPELRPSNLLVDFEGKPLDKVNSITRILNKIFNKRVGSSMLRHIFLTHKYGDKLKDQKETAKKMGHSVDMSNDYIKIKGGGKLIVDL